MGTFTDMARRHTSGSPILENRTKIQTGEIIARYPGGVTITSFDFINGRNGKYVVCTFKEDPARYFNGGTILTGIFEDFIANYADDGVDFETAKRKCVSDFEKETLKVKLSEDRTKAGNRITLVEVLD